MRVLVCGGRDFFDAKRMADVLDDAATISVVIHGAARGADMLADAWAKARGIPTQPFYANWEQDGFAAGPIRNQRMLDEGKPELVIAFPGGRGTADMVLRATKAGVPVVQVDA